MSKLFARNYNLDVSYSQVKTASIVGATSIDVDSTVGFTVNDFILIGTPGEEGCEITGITAITDSDTLAVTALSYAHLVDEPVYFIPYDQIEFNRRSSSGGSSEVITTKTMTYENNEFTVHDYPNVSTSDYYVYRYRNSYTSNYSEYSDEYQISTPYCSVQDVADYLNQDIRNDTPIKSSQVEKMIDGITKDIDDETHSSWTAQTVTNEYHNGLGNRGSDYFLLLGPIISITTLQTTQSDEDTDSSSVTWDTLTENNDYFLDKETGKIGITNDSYNPINGRNRLKVTYIYGHSSIPRDIKRLTTLMVIRDLAKTGVMRAVIGGHSEFTSSQIQAFDNEIDKILNRNHREIQFIS